MHYLKTQGIVQNAIMGVYLSKVENDVLSHIDFGELDRTLIQDRNIHWTPTIDRSNWFVALSSAALGDNELMLNSDAAIVDTGSSYLSIPTCSFSTTLINIRRLHADCTIL